MKLFFLRRPLWSQNLHALHGSPPVPFPWGVPWYTPPTRAILHHCFGGKALGLIWVHVGNLGADLAVYVWFTDEVSFALAWEACRGTLILCANWSHRCACIVSGLNCWCGVDWALVFLHHYIYSVLCACGFPFIHRAAAESAVWGLRSKQSQFNRDEELGFGQS